MVNREPTQNVWDVLGLKTVPWPEIFLEGVIFLHGQVLCSTHVFVDAFL